MSDQPTITAEDLRGKLAAHRTWLEAQTRGSAPEGAQLVIQRVALSGLTLKGANFSCAEIVRCVIKNASFTDCDFSYAVLIDTTFTDCSFLNCKFVKADLRSANLSKNRFIASDLTRADLTDANLAQADLTRSILDWTWLVNTDLRFATLEGVQLDGARLVGAKLHNDHRFSLVITERTVVEKIDQSKEGNGPVVSGREALKPLLRS